MEDKRITITRPLLHDKTKRKRKTRCYTLDDKTIKALTQLVADGEAGSLSRVIDLAVEFYVENRASIPVNFKAAEVRRAFIQRAAASGFMPSDTLEALAVDWLKMDPIATAQRRP